MPTLDNPESAMIVASRRDLPTFSFNGAGKEAKEKALQSAALIARVTDRDSKIVAVRAQQELKKVIIDIEKLRKTLKEPLLMAGRQLDNLCASESMELQKEFGRVSEVVAEFDNAERRRVLEEERLQREELARIEREKQAELKRIADELAAKEAEARRIQEEEARKLREQQEAAAKASRDAANEQERKAAAKLLAEAAEREKGLAEERKAQEAELAKQAAVAASQTADIEEKAGDAAYVAARPIEITTVAGQRTTSDWEITKINEWALLKGRPDLVRKIEFDMRAIKDALKRGEKLPGVEAKEVFNAGVKLPAQRAAIEV